MDQNIVEWLQGWYRSRCDGEWEHTKGVLIDTLDNPGWRVVADVGDGRPARRVEVNRTESDWVFCLIKDGQFIGTGGPTNLAEILQCLRSWVDESSGAPDDAL